MSHYVITQIHLEAGRIEAVRLHQVDQAEEVGAFVLDDGEVVPRADVANLIVGGDTVHLGIADGQGAYSKGAPVTVGGGQQEDLVARDSQGHPSGALHALPRF